MMLTRGNFTDVWCTTGPQPEIAFGLAKRVKVPLPTGTVRRRILESRLLHAERAATGEVRLTSGCEI